jgi:hypothetical protein
MLDIDTGKRLFSAMGGIDTSLEPTLRIPAGHNEISDENLRQKRDNGRQMFMMSTGNSFFQKRNR